ncbi:DUF190 domain-containing protein [Anaerolinea thermophila]|uniref:DUF190 domain-containing protein n=1 Tax=Anaerolinea thermophila TaxID=167964 RepID=UPI0026EABDC7|nr:DUF190 domain-containing protein [Anaerolinea thermophila]
MDFPQTREGLRLRIYLGESDRWRGKLLYVAILDVLRQQKVAGATVLRGISGFGAHAYLRSADLEVLSSDLPIIIEVVDTPEKIHQALESISPMVQEGMITLEEVNILKYTQRLLNPLPAERLVSEVMTRNVIHLTPEMSVRQAWQRMLESGIKAMPVVDAEGQVVGILTSEDLLERGVIRQRLSVAVRLDESELQEEMRLLSDSPLRVKDVMTQPVITVREDEHLGKAVRRMIEKGLKRLPVVNARNQLVGMLSRLDVLRQISGTVALPESAAAVRGAVRTVGEVMRTDLPVIHLHEGIDQIVEKFAASASNRLLVVDEHRNPLGVLSDSDVVARVEAAQRKGVLHALRRLASPPPLKVTAADLYSRGVLTVPPDFPIASAVQTMLAEGRKVLAVVDEAGSLLGVVDRQALMEALYADFAEIPGAGE